MLIIYSINWCCYSICSVSLLQNILFDSRQKKIEFFRLNRFNWSQEKRKIFPNDFFKKMNIDWSNRIKKIIYSSDNVCLFRISSGFQNFQNFQCLPICIGVSILNWFFLIFLIAKRTDSLAHKRKLRALNRFVFRSFASWTDCFFSLFNLKILKWNGKIQATRIFRWKQKKLYILFDWHLTLTFVNSLSTFFIQ